MLNKRKRRGRSSSLFNPKKIDAHNKFLMTLDSYFLNLEKAEKVFFCEKDQTNNTEKTNKTDKTEKKDEQCNKSDKEKKPFIQFIDDKSAFTILKSPFFSNEYKLFDSLCLDIEVNDPNIYQDLLKETDTSGFKRIPTPLPKLLLDNLENVEYKKLTIDCNIQTLEDILQLIDKYPLEPYVEYNINLKSLHNVKEHLIQLNNMIGMKQLKNNIVDQLLYFSQNFHKNENGAESGDFMHTVLYGPPGTGKTELAKIMGSIFSNLGILEKNKFLKVTRSDLIAGYLGQTALKTKDVVKDALGGVLFIDEAYALGNSEKRDSFSKECIDTLCEALSDNKDNLMVIIAGYEEDLKECFFNYNQGLDSRFTWRFKMDQYTSEDLYNIFVKKTTEIGWTYSSSIDANWFKEKMDYFKCFGRDMETLLAKTKIAHSRRVFGKPGEEKRNILLVDLENGFKSYLNNSDIQKRKETEDLKKQMYNSLYC